MKIKVDILDFHWDNYQGGSGKTVEYSVTISVPFDMLAEKIHEHVVDTTSELVGETRSFKQDNDFIILRMEIV